MPEPSCTDAFAPFVELLAKAAQDSSWLDGGSHAQVAKLLDGAAGQAVITHVPKLTRSKDGIFFSGHKIAERTVRHLIPDIYSGASVYDPACGAGDLLLAAATTMRLGGTIDQTLEQWGKRIGGCDIHAGFVQATKWRLLILAMLRHKLANDRVNPLMHTKGLFPNIVTGSYFDSLGSENYDCIITNPPYGGFIPADPYPWGKGQVQLAGIFMDHIFREAKAGQKIAAILPDVLRSGSRYGKWRAMIAQSAKVLKVSPYGRFDRLTDVDVFILKAEVERPASISYSKSISWTSPKSLPKDTVQLGQIFDVCVGPVVPHRHKEIGPKCPYIDVRHAKPFSEIYASEKRAFEGTLIAPPFVVIRRTSNPADANRLVSTIVKGSQPVAVENHLLVLKPKDKKLKTCRAIHKHLTSTDARNWVNSQIRCRHITTKAILAMPVYKSDFSCGARND
jgi:hypothetical protein